MRKTLAATGVAAVATGLAVAGGRVLARLGRRGEGTDDDFRRVAVMGGEQLTVTAEELHGGDVLLGMGGVSLDLTGATPADEGAVLRVRGVMGGVSIQVPDTWRVTSDLKGVGGMSLDTTPADDLPDDAPRLHVDAVVLLGGVSVEGVPHSDAADLHPQPAEAGTAH